MKRAFPYVFFCLIAPLLDFFAQVAIKHTIVRITQSSTVSSIVETVIPAIAPPEMVPPGPLLETEVCCGGCLVESCGQTVGSSRKYYVSNGSADKFVL